MSAQSFMKFYPQDWLGETKLRTVGMAAKGLWIDMLCMMHLDDRPGYLTLEGSPMTAPQLAAAIGLPLRSLRPLLEALEKAGVVTVIDGCYCSKRMLNDIEKLNQAREFGKIGGQKSVAERVERGVKGPVNPRYQKPDSIEKKETQPVSIPSPILKDRDRHQQQAAAPKLNGKNHHQPVDQEPPPGFDEFWKASPRKYDQCQTIKEFRAAVLLPGVTVEMLIAQMGGYGRDCERRKTKIEHIKAPAWWLRDKRWTDEYEPAEAGPDSTMRLAFDMMRSGQLDRWPDVLGPWQGQPGCRIPEALLVEYGYSKPH